MSRTDVFFDSNVILYLAGSDFEKADRSDELMRLGGVVSVQVLNEIVRVTRSKFKLDWRHVDLLLSGVRRACRIEPVIVETHELALKLARRHQIHIFDANILAAAVLAGCKVLYSEDMHNGLVVDGVTVTNPYKPVALPRLALGLQRQADLQHLEAGLVRLLLARHFGQGPAVLDRHDLAEFGERLRPIGEESARALRAGVVAVLLDEAFQHL